MQRLKLSQHFFKTAWYLENYPVDFALQVAVWITFMQIHSDVILKVLPDSNL